MDRVPTWAADAAAGPEAAADKPTNTHSTHTTNIQYVIRASRNNIFIYSLIYDIDFIMVISDDYLDVEVCLYFSGVLIVAMLMVRDDDAFYAAVLL